MVRKYDHVKPRRDLERWLDYVGMTEEEFDATCDTFRDPRVWRIEDGRWFKDNIWGGESDLRAGPPVRGPHRTVVTLKETRDPPDHLKQGQEERFAADIRRLLAHSGTPS